MAKIGRPTIYSKDLANKICKEISKGKSLRTVCAEKDMPDISMIFDWFRIYEDFSKQYAQATEERTESQQEMLIDLGDQAIAHAEAADSKASNAVVSAYKLKADNLKWSMSKMKPKKYGDKLDMTTNGKDLPTPLLHGIHNHNSNKKNSESK